MSGERLAGKITRFVWLLRADGTSRPSCSSQCAALADFAAGGHVVGCKLCWSHAEVPQEIRIGEVEDAGECQCERVDGAACAWADGLDGYLVFGLGDYAFAGEARVDRGDACRVPARSAGVLGVGRIVAEHVPECFAGPGAEPTACRRSSSSGR